MFVVDETPYCLWDWELDKRNLDFLDQIDHEYFKYIVEAHFPNIGGDNSQRAAIVLKTTYHQALETFFTLLFAAFQAPGCVVAYVHKCTSGHLRSMINKIQTGRAKLFNRQGIDFLSWTKISDTVNLVSYEDIKRTEETKELFARLWSRFGHAYLDDSNINEYNSIKHGFRLRPGGFTLRIGTEPEYGVAPPEGEMKIIGDSKFGSTFYVAEPIKDLNENKYKRNFRVREHSVNWNPENIAHALQLLSLSISNIISYVKVLHGVDPKTLPFKRPQSSEYFEEPFKRSTGVLNIAMNHIITKEDITPFTNEEIIEGLKNA